MLVIFLYSCSVKNNPNDNSSTINYRISDYLFEFSKINGDNPKAILIHKDENSSITIRDLPERASLGYLQSSLEGKDSLNVGMVSNVLCIYYLNEINKCEIIHEKVPFKLKRKTKQIEKIVMEGKEIIISNDLIEWHPSLEIKYDLLLKKKILNNHTDRTEKTLPLP